MNLKIKKMARKKKIETLVEEVFAPVLDQPIGAEVEAAIVDAATYLNCERALASVHDGCKTSYRRLIWSSLQFPKGELQPSVKLINGMSSYHGHSLSGCEPLLACMVKSGIMTGSGSFGIKSILGPSCDKDAASPRYTKTRLSDTYYNIIKPTLQCTPLVESEVGALEPKCLGFVFPLCLYFKNLVQGIGYGISTVYPNFSPRSLYAALINDDPNLLEPNVNLFIDKENSELQKLWETGKGRVIYSYKLSPYVNEDGKQGFLFEGDACLFTPNLKKIQKYVELGQVFIDDLTTKEGPKMFIGLVNNRGLKIGDLEKLCRQCCYDATTYQLNVTDGRSAFRIPLRDWLRYTYTNFLDLSKRVNAKEIEKCMFDISVQEALPLVSNYIINVNPKATDKELVTKLGLPQEVVEAVMSKPISYLRKNKDTSERVKSLKEKLKALKSFSPEKYAEEIIMKL